MKRKKRKIKKKYLILGLIIITIIYILLVKFYDVEGIGPDNSKIGFALLNYKFHELTGYKEGLYKLTEYLGLLPFLLVVYYGIIGLIQLIKRKSIFKVDKKIINLGIFYICLLFVYIFFEKVVINYRPIMIDHKLEPSFPSSHTLLALCVCISSLLISKDYIKNDTVRKIVDILTYIVMILLVIGRLLCGVHWLTDIIGSVLISYVLVSIYDYSITEKKINNLHIERLK